MRPSLVNAKAGNARREAQAEILTSLRGPLAPVRRALLRWLFRYNEIYMAVRDNHRFYVDRNWYALRRVFRSFGARLAAAGVLDDRDEVFFLGTEEVDQGLADQLAAPEAARRVAVRRRVWVQTTLRQQGPKFLKGWPGPKPTTAAPGAPSRPASCAASPPARAWPPASRG